MKKNSLFSSFPLFHWISYCLLALVLASCGGGSGDAQSPVSVTPATSAPASSTIASSTPVSSRPASSAIAAGFPRTLSVVSPLDVSVPLGGSAVVGRSAGVRAEKSRLEVRALIAEILANRSLLSTRLAVQDLFQTAGDAQDCYGPTMTYDNHPNTPMGQPDSGELPGGDLGIWVETMPDHDGDTIAEACAAGELNARMQGLDSRTTMSLAVMAALKTAYVDTGVADISTNLPAGVSISNQSVTISSDKTLSTYSATITTDRDHDSVNETVIINLKHYQDVANANIQEGLLTIQVADRFMGGNCGMGNNDISRYASIHYLQNSATDSRLQAREATFCGNSSVAVAGHDAFSEPVQSVNAGITGSVLNPDKSWSDNFSVFTEEFDPSTGTTGELVGTYSYTWQAGSGDSNSRILDVGLTIGSGGESYFGYGNRVQDVATINGFGEIGGMICNWAGPGGNHTLQNYAQRQHLKLDASAGFYVPTNAAASDITYAPTNSCMYDGTQTFKYDRNLNDTLDEATTALAVGVGYSSGGTGLDFDLLGLASASPSIWDTITNNRHYSLPAYPTN